ncbi:MAG: hypothetical protein KA956_05885, partial [Pyrinomonadaceae bacterium]|nr:hypothetical protein [Pyrinomonadaceae bacterium]
HKFFNKIDENAVQMRSATVFKGAGDNVLRGLRQKKVGSATIKTTPSDNRKTGVKKLSPAAAVVHLQKWPIAVQHSHPKVGSPTSQH